MKEKTDDIFDVIDTQLYIEELFVGLIIVFCWIVHLANEIAHFVFAESRLLTINDFLFDTRLDNLNLFKIIKYCKRSFIAKKVFAAVCWYWLVTRM